MPRFAYAPDLVERFPLVVGGVVHAVDLSNGPTPPDLARAFHDEQAAVRERIGTTPLSELPAISAWRRAFRAFGVDPTAYRSAAEALLRRLTKQGSLPSINALVDLGNLVSIRYGLPVAVLDLAALHGRIDVTFAVGTETFTDLASGTRESPDPGEVIFIDEAGLVAARRWCWRQAAETASTETTRDVLVTVEAHHDGGLDEVRAAVRDLDALLPRYAKPAAVATGLVSAARPAIEVTARR